MRTYDTECYRPAYLKTGIWETEHDHEQVLVLLAQMTRCLLCLDTNNRPRQDLNDKLTLEKAQRNEILHQIYTSISILA